jgi:hypothetical protein
MTKLDEMWAALATYQPKADAAGHGESWAKMCKEKTSAAAYAAALATYAATYAAANDAAAAAAAYAANAAADDAYATDADAYCAAVTDAADKWAQRAIDLINKAKEENT